MTLNFGTETRSQEILTLPTPPPPKLHVFASRVPNNRVHTRNVTNAMQYFGILLVPGTRFTSVDKYVF